MAGARQREWKQRGGRPRGGDRRLERWLSPGATHLAVTIAAVLATIAGSALQADRAEALPTSTARSSGISASARPAQCTLTELERYPIRLGGRDIYVEPEIFTAEEDGFLLAGQPVYEWSTAADGFAEFEADRVLGVRIERGEVTPLERPPGVGTIADVRMHTLGEGRRAWLLEAVFPREDGGRDPDRIWYAEERDGAWSTPEVVPLPEQRGARFHGSSKLVRDSAGLYWTLPAGGPRDAAVLEYHRSMGRWSFEAMPAGTIDPEWVEATEAVYTNGVGGAVVALTGREPALDHRRSLRLLDPRAPEAAWRVDSFDGEALYSRLSLADAADGLALGWLRVGLERTDAWGIAGWRPSGWDEPVLLADAADGVVTVTLRDGPALWIVSRYSDGQSQAELRFIHGGPGAEPETIATLPNPYTGFFAAAVTDGGELVLVGPEMSPVPTAPTVRSLLIRFDISCT